MAFQTFAPAHPPKRNGREEPKLAINKIQFGDGYSQRSTQGINAVVSVVTLTFEALSDAEATAIMDFMNARAQAGLEAFYYKLPWHPTAKLWTCEKYSRTRDERRFDNVDITLEEAFDPA